MRRPRQREKRQRMQSNIRKPAPSAQECVWVATLRKPIGIKGRVAFTWRDPFFFDNVQISEGSFLFVERDGLLVPYELLALEPRGDGTASVGLGFVETPSDAKELQRLRVFVPNHCILDMPSDSLHNGDLATLLMGHYVEDENGNPVGCVSRVDQYPMNVVLTVERHKGGEVLLPLSEELLIEMPTHAEPSEAHPLRLRIPEGLL